MIITETKALNLIQNEDAIRAVPPLAFLYEEYRKIERNVKKRTNCNKCSLTEPEFQGFRGRILEVIAGLDKVNMTRLKEFLVTKEIVMFLVPPEGGKAERKTF